MSQAPVPRKLSEVVPQAGPRGLQLQNLDEMIRFASGLIQAGMAPKGLTAQPGAVVALIQAGAEIGLPPMWSLSNLTFVNGRLGIMGDAALALIRSRGLLEPRTDFRVEYTGAEMTPEWTCVVTAQRAGHPPASRKFSLADAVRAGLGRFTEAAGWKASKGGPWDSYPQRMLYYRALGFLTRDEFSDVLYGLVLTEELRDYPPVRGESAVPASARGQADPLLIEAAQDAPGLTIEAEPVETPGTAAEGGAAPACTHPDGFSPSEGSLDRTCIHCGEVRP